MASNKQPGDGARRLGALVAAVSGDSGIDLEVPVGQSADQVTAHHPAAGGPI